MSAYSACDSAEPPSPQFKESAWRRICFFQKCVKKQDFIFQNQIQIPLKIIIPLINTILENTIQVGIMSTSAGA